jgi:hypothetical protein
VSKSALVKATTCACLLTFAFKLSFAQGGRSFLYSESTYIIFSTPRPHNFDKPEALMRKEIRQEMIYMYSQKGKRIDSELVVAKYFDSTGQCIEKDEYDTSKPVSITNYTYTNDRLAMAHSLISSAFYNDIIVTYDYDESGNKTGEKTYSKYASDTTGKYEFRAERKWQYDSLNHLSLVFNSKYDSMSLNSKYYYSNDTLRLIENFNDKNQLTSSEYYDYDAKSHIKKIYGRKNKKDLKREFFYDEANNLIKEIDYSSFSDDVNTLTYEYSDGCLISERFHSKYDHDIYFKCYYL